MTRYRHRDKWKKDDCKTRKVCKLDDGLCIHQLEICVPKICDFDGRDDCPDGLGVEKRWGCYLEWLRKKYSICLPIPCPAEACKPCCSPCVDQDASREGGWKLRGHYAIAHAREVHKRLHRQFLRFRQVSAIDVGFAVLEEQNAFHNCLALRIHVAAKKPTYLLREGSIPSFTSLRYLCPDPPKDPCTGRCQCGNPAPEPVGGGAEAECGGPCPCYLYCREDHLDGMDLYRRYPIAGIRRRDMSCYRCPGDLQDLCPEACGCSPRGLERNHGEGWNGYRLCLFGVPVDIVDARYFPSHGHSHQTLEQGVFSAPLERGDELSDAEMILTGRNRVEPLVGGISIGSTIGQAGTLGAIVWDRTDGRPCILSNWHVMAGTVDAGVGEPVYQPSFFDGGQSDDVVAHLKRWHLADLGDAAIAELNGEREYASGEILGMWHPISGTKSPELKMEVIKWGRSTGFTEGFIDGIDLATNLDYGGGVIRYFRHQFHISPLFRGKDVSQVGDSGALVLTAVNTDRLGSDLCSAKKRTWSVEASRRELLEDKDFWKKCRKYWQEASKDGGKASFEKIAKRAHDELDEERRSLADGTPDTVRSQKPDQGKNHIIEEELLDRIYGDFPDSTQEVLEWLGADIEFWERRKKLAEYHSVRRVYYAVGLIFAGDTPGSPFGEFALASDISLLEKAMQFSLRPVFEPRSSFRKLRTIERGGHRRRRGRGRGRLLEPGAERGDDRPEGPQPDPEPIQTGGG